MDRLAQLARIRSALAGLMNITGYSFDNARDLIFLKGSLNGTPAQSALQVRSALAPLGLEALVQPRLDGLVDVQISRVEHLVPEGTAPAQPHPLASMLASRRLPFVLFALTALSVFITGSLENDGAGGLKINVPNGLMFAASLLAILGAHEFGHWIVARAQGEKPSLPLFIPFPFSLVGTLGAVIVQQTPFKNRRALLQMALAGPAMGFLVAVPLFVIGILISEIKPIPPDGAMFLGDSLLTKAVSLIRPVDVSTGVDIFMHPIGMAGWIGLLLTGVNLLPAGQLDGGHIAYAVLGRHARVVTAAVIVTLAVLALFVSQEWFVWVILLGMFGRNHPPVQDEATPLTLFHFGLAIVAVLMLALTFVPQPIILPG